MTGEKIEKAVSNLELAVRKIELYQKRAENTDGGEFLGDSIVLIRDSLDILRGLEVSQEIEFYSDPD
jgi:hypothetical protein